MDNKTSGQDSISSEIAEYSIKENVAYISLAASALMQNKQIPDVPHPILVTTIIQIAEDFDREFGSEVVGDDTVKAINQFAEERLKEQFGL